MVVKEEASESVDVMNVSVKQQTDAIPKREKLTMNMSTAVEQLANVVSGKDCVKEEETNDSKDDAMNEFVEPKEGISVSLTADDKQLDNITHGTKDFVMKEEATDTKDGVMIDNDFVEPKEGISVSLTADDKQLDNITHGTKDFVMKEEATDTKDGVMIDNDFVEPKREVIDHKEEIAVNMTSADEEKFTGEFRDQGDANWILIRGQLRGHNDTPFEHDIS